MYINYLLIDKVLSKNDVVKKCLLGTGLISTSYAIYKNSNVNDDLGLGIDLRIKEKGKCDKELVDFGNCLEKNNDNYDKCKDFLEAYKRCLQSN